MAYTHVSHVAPNLWVGNASIAGHKPFFDKYNIGAVVNCTPDVPTHFKAQGVKYMRLDLDDSSSSKDQQKMYAFLPRAVAFIRDQIRQGRNVLVHCHAGIQRSATVAVAYLASTYGMSLQEAADAIHSRRPVVFYGNKQFNFQKPLIDNAIQGRL